MTQNSRDSSPNARRILNEIMMLLFTPSAIKGGSISSDQVSALISKFTEATRTDVATVKVLLSKLLDQINSLERQIELREIEQANKAFKVALRAQEEQLRAIRPVQAERLRNEARKKLRKWYVTDHAVVLKKIEFEELLTLSEFIEARGVSKRAVNNAIAWRRIFFITGTDGQNYYPKFFADSNDNVRQSLGKVCQVLGNIPAYAKYQFLIADLHCLIDSTSPLEAIRSGRVADVLQAIEWLLKK